MNVIVLSIPVFFLLIGIEIIYDRIQHKKLYRLNDAVANISCGIFEQITGVFAKVFTVAMYAFVFEHWRLTTLPNTWYWLGLLFLATDLAYYWAHRMSHEINLFWIGHVVHHQSEEYNLSVALRQGALQKVFTSFFYLPLALAGFSVEYFLLLAAFNTLYQFWIHTEAIGKLGPLEWILNTPSHHRVHHGRDPKYIDRNHAGVFIIWDKMFDTFQKEEEHAVYGITTPARTWDAVTSHIRPFQNLVTDWKRIREWKYKLLLLVKPPGWMPETYGGYRHPQPVQPDTYEKFETHLNRQMNYYLLFHFLLILASTSLFLFNLPAFSISMQVLIVVLISFSIMTTGWLFEGRAYARWVEVFRIILFAALVLLAPAQTPWPIPLTTAFFTVLLASAWWLLRYYRPETIRHA